MDSGGPSISIESEGAGGWAGDGGIGVQVGERAWDVGGAGDGAFGAGVDVRAWDGAFEAPVDEPAEAPVDERAWD
eukprot:12660413-Alexandrium_andersonii.AAC.1